MSMAAKVLVALFALFALTQSTPLQRSQIATKATGKLNYYRLPKNAVPKAYNITVHPNFATFTFDGYAEILIDLVEPSKNVTLHAKNLTFVGVRFFGKSSEVKIAKVESDEVRDFRVLHFGSSLPKGQYTIKVNYTGYLAVYSTRGFYRTSYIDAAGKVRWLAATHFEPVHARKAFPCFDEPALKATFSVKIRRNSAYNSISNMPLLRTILQREYHEDVYETTPLTSTYLVAFAVSDFKNISKANHRVFAESKAIAANDAKFALDLSAPLLKALEDYTKVKYVLPKMDQIALPEFPAGAMENWGLVTYKDTRLLYNATKNTVEEKQKALLIISHEYVHQWFGDLVGPDWWKYLWLNEGFARYYQYIAGDKVKPTWRLNDQLMHLTLFNILKTDATAKTRPITWDVGSPSEIAAIFDTISYDKAGMVLRMLTHALTEPVFRNGISKYLNARKYAAAVGSDLWNGMQKAADEAKLNLNVLNIAATWEHQKGYPLLTVKRNYNNGAVEISQDHFVQDESTQNKTMKWFVPVNYATLKQANFTNTKADFWLKPNEILKFNVTPGDWLLVNKQQTGYYRVNYDEKNWKLLADYLNTANYDKIHHNSRAQLINDAFALAQTGRISFSVALDLTKYLHREIDYVALSSFFGVLPEFNKIAHAINNYSRFESHVSSVLDKALSVLGFAEKANANEDAEHINNLNRVKVIRHACEYGNKKCWSGTTGLLQNVNKVSATLQEAVICGGLRNADETTWNKIYNQSYAEKNQVLATKLKTALGCSNNPTILTKYVARELDAKRSVFSNIYTKGRQGIQFTFDYLLKNFENIYQKLGKSSGEVITGIAVHLNTDEQYTKLVALQTNNKHKDVAQSFKTAVTTVKENVARAKLYSKDITAWIQKELK